MLRQRATQRNIAAQLLQAHILKSPLYSVPVYSRCTRGLTCQNGCCALQAQILKSPLYSASI